MRARWLYLALFHFIDAESKSLCDWTVDIIVLQDVSSSFANDMEGTAVAVRRMINETQEKFDNVRFALSTFIDKPAPFRGHGNGRGHPGTLDYCYKRAVPLTHDITEVVRAYENIMESTGNGGDGPENVYEAMYYASVDDALGYEPGNGNIPARAEAQSVRLLLVITDDLPHYAGDLHSGFELWNRPNDGPTTSTKGTGSVMGGKPPHFLDREFITFDFGYTYPPLYGNPNEVAFRYYDLVNFVNNGTKSDDPQFAELMKELGPARGSGAPRFPYLQSYDSRMGSGRSDSICASAEYPTLPQVSEALKRRNIIPIAALRPPARITRESRTLCAARRFPVSTVEPEDSFMRCMMNIYQEDLTSVDSDALVFELNDATESLSHILLATLDLLGSNTTCPPSPTIIRWISGALASVAGVGLLLATLAHYDVCATTTRPVRDGDDFLSDDSGPIGICRHQ